MRRARVALAALVGLTSGCVYYNTIYNAERLFQEGEQALWAGRDSVAAARYDEVIRKAAEGFRRGPEGPWADDALLLLGRAHLRRGDVRAARAALGEAAATAETEAMRLSAVLYLGTTYIEAGDRERGVALLDEALRGLLPGPIPAEGHLWRGRVLLAAGETELGWWDLDRAGPVDARLRTPAALERVRWALHYDEQGRARDAVGRLLSFEEAGEREAEVATLVRDAAQRWGPETAAELLIGADSAAWSRPARGRIQLVRAGLLGAARDTAGAREQLRSVADGFGDTAEQARLDIARLQLADARGLLDARAVVPLLLPAAGAPVVRSLLDDVELMLELADAGLSESLAWFAAGEIARDRLGAAYLARGLFLAYADASSSEPWAPKAILAALGATSDEEDRAWLRGRLEGRPTSPYVRAARGQPAPGLEALEDELGRRLEEIRR